MAPFIDNSYFFCRYIIQVAFLTNSIQLLGIPPLLARKFRMLIARSEYERVYAFLIKKYFDFGFNYSFALVVFLLTLIFSTTIPLIVPFGCLFFYIKYHFDKYNLIFYYPVEFEGSNTIGEMVIKFMMFGILFFQMCISGLFYVLSDNENSDYINTISILYVLIAIILYFVSKNIFSKVKNRTSSKLFDTIYQKQETPEEEEKSEIGIISQASTEVSTQNMLKNNVNNLKASTTQFKVPKYKNNIVKNTEIELHTTSTLSESLIDSLFSNSKKPTKESEIEVNTFGNLSFIKKIKYKEEATNRELLEDIKKFKIAYMHPTQRKLKDTLFDTSNLFSSLTLRKSDLEVDNDHAFNIRRLKNKRKLNIISEDDANFVDELVDIN